MTFKVKLVEEFSDDDFLDSDDKKLFEYYLTHEDALLMEMANLRGNDIKLHDRIPFSLYISTKEVVHGAHAIRVKVLWNPNKMTSSPDGQIELHGDYEYKIFSHKYKPSEKEISTLRNFCKKYKVFFSAIWESKLDSNDFIDYLRNIIQFNELLTKFDSVSEKHYYLINHCKSIEELEKCIRDNKIFNMND